MLWFFYRQEQLKKSKQIFKTQNSTCLNWWITKDTRTIWGSFSNTQLSRALATLVILPHIPFLTQKVCLDFISTISNMVSQSDDVVDSSQYSEMASFCRYPWIFHFYYYRVILCIVRIGHNLTENGRREGWNERDHDLTRILLGVRPNRKKEMNWIGWRQYG